jgi:hypothetical protein
MNNGKNIFNHLAFWRQVIVVENQNFTREFAREPCVMVEPKTAKSVFVGNDNQLDIA